jgi:hypothetical protein
MEMLSDLFPFRINSLAVRNGSIHFRAFASDPPLDAALNDLEASIENLTNIHNEFTPLVATITASGLAMDHAKFEYQMKMDPSSYRPTFEMAFSADRSRRHKDKRPDSSIRSVRTLRTAGLIWSSNSAPRKDGWKAT